jgi:DNA replication protein DnaC
MNELRTPWQRRILGLTVTHPAVQRLADAVEQYAKGMMEGDSRRKLVIVGECGNGKTRVLECLWRWHRSIPISRWPRCNHDAGNDGFSCELAEWPSAVDAVMRTGEDGRWQDMLQCGFLLLDDIGREVDKFKSGQHTMHLATLLGARQGLWTVVTTNVPASRWHKQWDQRVTDRLFRDSRIFDLGDCPSFAFAAPPAPRVGRRQESKATEDQMRQWAVELAHLRESRASIPA